MLNHLAWIQSNVIVMASLIGNPEPVEIYEGTNLKCLNFSNGFIYFMDNNTVYEAKLSIGKKLEPLSIMNNVFSFHVTGSEILYILMNDLSKAYFHNIHEPSSYKDITNIDISYNDAVNLYFSSDNIYITKNSSLYINQVYNSSSYLSFNADSNITSIFEYTSDILCICTKDTIYYEKNNEYINISVPQNGGITCYNEIFYTNNIEHSNLIILGILRTIPDYTCNVIKTHPFSYEPKVHFNNGPVKLSLDSKEMQYTIINNKLVRSDHYSEDIHTSQYSVNLYISDEFNTIVQNVHISLCDI